MKLITSKKAIVGFLGLSSLVLAQTFKDIKSNSVSHIENDDKEAVVKLERNVASDSKVAQMYLPVNEENIKKINTVWEITRIVDEESKVAFDKFQNIEDSKKSIKIKMELIGNGMVRVDGDNEQVYRVSILTDFGTIALFKKMDKGFEILEAKKFSKNIEKNNVSVENEVDLVLERALNQSKSNKVLVGDSVSGQMTLSQNNISGFSVELRNENGETQNVEIDFADLLDGGSFKAEFNGEEISGVLFNNGKDGYRVSFVTGPLAGAMLNFVTKESFDSILEKDLESSRDQMDQGSEIEQKVEESQAPIIEQRKLAAENTNPEVLTAEEVKESAQLNGFSF